MAFCRYLNNEKVAEKGIDTEVKSKNDAKLQGDMAILQQGGIPGMQQ